MKNQYAESVRLAWRDWKFEFLLSLCGILALASMLTPILVLMGLKNGVITGMRSRLLEDPAILIITPKSDAGRFDQKFIDSLRSLPDARFAIGRTRETATDITLFNPVTETQTSIGLEPSQEGEPVLEYAKIAAPVYAREPQIVLSQPAAKALKTKIGDTLTANLGRRAPSGKLESEELTFHVSAILPIESADRKMAFVPLQLLEDMENYRDYIEVPSRGFAGNPANGSRQFSSFRLYAKNLDSVEPLTLHLESLKIESTSRAREIANIKLLEKSIDQVILIISLAVGLGFAAFTVSSALTAVQRKKKMLGMLRLLGLKRKPLIFYPLTQTFLTSFCGFVLSILISFGVGYVIEQAFAQQGGLSCLIGWQDSLFAFSAIVILSIISSGRAAYVAASIEPSMVIREV